MMKYLIQNNYLHSNKVRFMHPLSPISDELRLLAGDFLLLLKAGVLGVLVRSPQRDISPTGRFRFSMWRSTTAVVCHSASERQIVKSSIDFPLSFRMS